VDTKLTLMQIFALSTAGMCHALLGSVKIPLSRKLEIDEARIGSLVSVFGFTLIPMAFAAGFLADSWGKSFVMVGGCALLIAAVLVLAWMKNYATTLLSVLLLGTGWSALVNVLNATQGPAFLPLEEIKDRLSFAMNLGDFVFGMGAFVMPIAVAISINKLGLRTTFLLFAGLLVLPLALSFGVDWERITAPPTADIEDAFSTLLADKFVWICCVAFFFHVPIEACVATWATTLMKDHKVTETRAAQLLSAFWLTFTVSRLVAALSLPKGFDHLVVVVMAGLCVVCTAGLVLSRSRELTCGLLITAGAILGPIFPILIALLLGHVDQPLHGRAIGLFFCIGGIGWAIVPFAVGTLAKTTSVQKAFSVVCGCAVCLTVLCIILNFAGGH